MWWLVAVFLVLVVIVLFCLPGDYKVEKSLRVNVSANKAFQYLSDLRNWVSWSPWLMHDPACQLKYDRSNEVEGSQSWDSHYVGAGTMTHVSREVGKSLDLRINFVRPFKSEAWSSLLFQDHGGDSCTITWTMSGKVMFFMRPMRKMITTMIGRDYELGLAMLAGVFDPKASHPRLGFMDITNYPTLRIISQRYEGSMEGLVEAMKTAYPHLVAQAGDKMSGPALAIYHKVNTRKNTTVCDIAVPVSEGGMQTLPGGKYFLATLQGSYDFLPLAWFSAINHMRMRKMKFLKNRPALEVYVTDMSKDPDPNNWKTEMYLPTH